MEFFKILDSLKEQYKDDMIIRGNGTILLSPRGVPRARHMLFKPLDDEFIEKFLISQYVYKFPKQYIEFLKYTNGADLCNTKMWHNIKKKKIPTTSGLFTIFGLPKTPPFARTADMEEPFDMRIEDLGRHDDIPDSWLKCGTYKRNYDFYNVCDIFIDTETEKVYACVRNQKDIVDSWNNLDECFCKVFHSFDDMKDEYEFYPKK
ncbi:MAG: SMI1/KNR4 family protein [Ruminococcaceae bacterium]|nr:SMI1/KNR4 family protein [Oscillospiraceae bacterium]